MPNKYTYATPDPFKLLQDKIGDLERRMQQVEPGIYPEEWHYVGNPGEPAFQGAWVNASAPYDSLGFMLDADGFVHLKGAVTGGSTSSVVFTLPASYCPPATIKIAIIQQSSADSCTIATNGNVTLPGAVAGNIFHLNFRFRIN